MEILACRGESMEIAVVKEGNGELELRVDGEETLVQAIRYYLLQDENVEFAAFKREHPLKGYFRLYVKVKEGDPREAIAKAIDKMKADLKTFLKAFQESWK